MLYETMQFHGMQFHHMEVSTKKWAYIPGKLAYLGVSFLFGTMYGRFFWGHVIAGGLSFHDATVCSKVA